MTMHEMYSLRELADAFKSIEPSLSQKELTDIRLLYENPTGFPFTLDKKNAPQGDTLQTSRMVGSRLKRHLKLGHKYGMNYIGYSDVGTLSWRMKDEFRSALDSISYFGPAIITKPGETKNAALIETPTTATTLTETRIGQDKFRAQLMEFWRGCCAVTGCAINDVLIASHIVPWADATNSERISQFNGLLLIANIDKLFDNHLISFEDSGKIIISNKIPVSDYKKLSIASNMYLTKVTDQHKLFLSRHREIFFLRA